VAVPFHHFGRRGFFGFLKKKEKWKYGKLNEGEGA